jgi:hypothetical protein
VNAALILALGVGITLVGDACHVASGTTAYPYAVTFRIWLSPAWFPALAGAGVLVAALVGRRANLPRQPRGRRHVVVAAIAVLALYALTAVLRGQPSIVSVTLCVSVALGIAAAWDPSPAAFAVAGVAAVVGPLGEIGCVALGAVRYAPGSDGLFGVAPWLPCIYFAAGGVASGLWSSIQRPSTAPRAT